VYFKRGLFFLGCLYVFCACFGYGSDYDIYGMLSAWRDFWASGHYAYSRPPGYPVPEFAVGLAAQIGGFRLSNLVSCALALIAIAAFQRLLEPRLSAPLAGDIALLAGLNPWWIVAASSSMDYVYSISFALLGLLYARKHRMAAAGAFFALSMGSRLSIAPLVILYWLYAWLSTDKSGLCRKHLLLHAAGTVTAVMVLYLPSFFYGGLSMFSVTSGSTTLPILDFSASIACLGGGMVRLAYKNAYLWGIPALALMAPLAVHFLRRFFKKEIARDGQRKAAAVLWIASVFYLELLFFRLPHEISYLLPLLFLATPLFAFSPWSPRAYVRVMAGLFLLYGAVSVETVEKTYSHDTFDRREAASGRFRVFLKKGVVWDDLEQRKGIQDHFIEKYGLR
jgi:hypothetical protein